MSETTNWNQTAVVATNDDATECKLAAVEAGYWIDDHLHFFVPKHGVKKAPLINRGHWTRVCAIDSLLHTFISQGGKQVVILGAGYDTSFLRFSFPDFETFTNKSITWFEIDLPQVVKSKIKTILSNPELRKAYHIGDVNASAVQELTELHSERYSLVSVDLNEGETALEKAFDGVLHKNLPTIFISECVLVYLDPEKGDNVISWVSKNFTNSLFVTYEQIKPFDQFGAMMMKNIKERGCVLRSVEKYPELSDQISRYKRLGFNQCNSIDMNKVTSLILQSDPTTINSWLSRVEVFDEFEEWTLIQSHYCLTVAVNCNQQNEFNWPYNFIIPPLDGSALKHPPLQKRQQQHIFLPFA